MGDEQAREGHGGSRWCDKTEHLFYAKDAIMLPVPTSKTLGRHRHYRTYYVLIGDRGDLGFGFRVRVRVRGSGLGSGLRGSGSGMSISVSAPTQQNLSRL